MENKWLSYTEIENLPLGDIRATEYYIAKGKAITPEQQAPFVEHYMESGPDITREVAELSVKWLSEYARSWFNINE